VRQKPGSANGIMFTTIEDETGRADTLRKTPADRSRIVDDGDQWPDPTGRGGRPSCCPAAVRLVSSDLAALANRDEQFKRTAERATSSRIAGNGRKILTITALPRSPEPSKAFVFRGQMLEFIQACGRAFADYEFELGRPGIWLKIDFEKPPSTQRS